MFYYRYRSGNELAIKELIYDEMYFASASECNDPYEGKLFGMLNSDQELWENLIQSAIRECPVSKIPYLVKKMVDYFVNRSPMYIDEMRKMQPDDLLQVSTNQFEQIILENAFSQVRNYINHYIPAEQYFISFSKQADNPLMWAHYANNHKGYCLIFRSENGKLYQNPQWKKRSFLHETPNAFSQKMSFSIGEAFEFHDVEYLSEPQIVDGFLCFPPCVSGDHSISEEVKKCLDTYRKAYLQKHSVWDYEQEVRLILSSGIPWIAQQPLHLTSHQRLFHYKPEQLVGIVLGACMSSEQKSRIKEIIKEKIDMRFDSCLEGKTISDFVLFEAKLSEENRKIEVKPTAIYGCLDPISVEHPEFSHRLTQWENGEAIRFTENGRERIIIT